MNEKELIKIMFEEKFSKKQIDKLKKLSDRYSSSLHETVYELSRRFYRSLFMHVLMFFFVLFAHFLLGEEHRTAPERIIFSVCFLLFMYSIFHILAPLAQGYKARKVIKTIKKERNR